MATDAVPLESVVPIADWAPRTKVTFLPETASPYSSTRLAVSVTFFDGPEESGPVYRVSYSAL